MKIKIKRTVWPSIFTLLNMFLGYLAITQILGAVQYEASDLVLFNEKIILAGWLVFVASILDGLDGKVARLVHGSSDFGVEIDSLADLLSFVIAPSLVIYYVYANDAGIPGILISFLYVVFGAIRLARFNVIAHRSSPTHFIGLPSPMAALVVISLPMFNIAWFGDVGRAKIMIPFLTVIGFLMVSKITFKKYGHFSLRKESGYRKETLIILVNLILTIVYREKILFILTILIIAANIIGNWRKHSLQDEEIEIDEEDIATDYGSH